MQPVGHFGHNRYVDTICIWSNETEREKEYLSKWHNPEKVCVNKCDACWESAYDAMRQKPSKCAIVYVFMYKWIYFLISQCMCIYVFVCVAFKYFNVLVCFFYNQVSEWWISYWKHASHVKCAYFVFPQINGVRLTVILVILSPSPHANDVKKVSSIFLI